MFSFVVLAPADPTAGLESRQGRPTAQLQAMPGAPEARCQRPHVVTVPGGRQGVCTGAGGAGEPSRVLPGPRPAGRSPMP